MISYIKWKIIELDFNNITVLTSQDIGYEIHINELTYSKISIEKDIELFVYHHIT
jgi:Holliday junction resolvasome RuvABC DNA-binding subunit